MSTLITAIMIILGFWAIISILGATVLKGKESVEIAPFQLLWRTKKFLNFIDDVGSKHRGFWKFYGDLGIIVGFVGSIVVFAYFIKQTLLILFPPAPQQALPSVQLVIPGITIPLGYGLLGLAVVIIVHELSHGFLARAENLSLKSVGLVLFFVIPGAFVEPDEEELKRAPLRARLRVFAAGSMANILTGLVALILMSVVGLAFVPGGIVVGGVIKDSPADGVLEPGDIIVEINGHPVPTLEDFIEVMNKTRPGEVITLAIIRDNERINISLKLGQHPENPEKGFIGMYPGQNIDSRVGFKTPLLVLFLSLYWIYVLNIGIGLMNLFPLVPLDGGRMLMDTLKEFLPEKPAKIIGYSIMGIGLVLLGINVIVAIRGMM